MTGGVDGPGRAGLKWFGNDRKLLHMSSSVSRVFLHSLSKKSIFLKKELTWRHVFLEFYYICFLEKKNNFNLRLATYVGNSYIFGDLRIRYIIQKKVATGC